jgi:hypothetical protein
MKQEERDIGQQLVISQIMENESVDRKLSVCPFVVIQQLHEALDEVLPNRICSIENYQRRVETNEIPWDGEGP